MPHNFKLDIRITDAEDISIEGSLGDTEKELLEDFLVCVDDIANTRLVKENMSSSLRLEGDESGKVTVAVQLPPWEDVQAFLHVFRPVLLKKEPTNFYKICNGMSKEINHPYFHGMIALQREMYNGKRLQEKFKIMSNEVVLNSEEVLQQWLNSHEFHRDPKKKKFIESLHQMLPLEASKAIFVSLLTEKTRATINIGLIARVLLGKQRQVTGRLRRPEQRNSQ